MKAGIIAIVPARGGSKGVPGKNVRHLAGKPLLAHTIDVAKQSGELSRVIVSTDDETIAEIARNHGAEVPFVRPQELATDDATSVDVVIHAVEWLSRHESYTPELVLMLQPTSPLRTKDDINGAISLQRKTNATSVVSVCEAMHPPQWLRRISENGELLPWLEGPTPSRRQDAEILFQLNGAVYLVKTSVLLQERTFFPQATRAYTMPTERSLDIDTAWDLRIAELVLTNGDSNA